MKRVKNTAADPSMPAPGIETLLFNQAMNASQPGFIEAMEAEGQKQLSESSQLPVDSMGADDTLLAFGIELGEPFQDDPIFRPAKLPAGWKITPTDHSMWSKLEDEKGRERASIFYKAAFYDRSCHLHLEKRFNISCVYFRADGSELPADKVYTSEADNPCTLTFYVMDSGETPLKEVFRSTVQVPMMDLDRSNQEEAARSQCEDWLNENYPEWRKYSAYWE